MVSATCCIDKSSDEDSATVTVTFDAEPVSTTPSNLPTLATGSYTVPLKNPGGSSSDCLKNPAQQSAWACADGPSVSLEIISNGIDMPQINILSELGTDGQIHYGPQPPQLSQPANLTIMNDKNDRGQGPAYFFQQHYNKTVILRSEEFDAGSYKRWSTRDIEAAESRAKQGRGFVAKNKIAQPSDKPWYCFWNETVLEGFIYARQPNGHAIQTSAPLASAPTPFGTSNPSSATSGQMPKRQATGLPCPKRVKLEERRTNLSPTPYCQQMQILNTGNAVPADPPVSQTLVEDEPAKQNRLLDDDDDSGQSRTTNGPIRKSVRNMESTPGACECQWVFA